MAITYRKAIDTDLALIVAMYNEIIAEGGYTADLIPYTIAQKKTWFKAVNQAPSAIFIVEHDDKAIGYFYFTSWRVGRAALQQTAEISYYLQRNHRGRRIGSKMIDWCMEEAKQAGFQHLLAIMLDINVGSKKILEQKGFWLAGHLKQIARLPSGICGQYLMQYSFQ